MQTHLFYRNNPNSLVEPRQTRKVNICKAKLPQFPLIWSPGLGIFQSLYFQKAAHNPLTTNIYEKDFFVWYEKYIPCDIFFT